MLGKLTYVVDSLIDLEEKAKSHAEELGGSGRLATRLESYSKELEDLRGRPGLDQQGGLYLG